MLRARKNIKKTKKRPRKRRKANGLVFSKIAKRTLGRIQKKGIYFIPLQTLQSNLSTTVTLRKWQGNRNIQGDRYIQVNFAENKATENLGNLFGDCNIQGDRYIQVNFAENIRQLKILESCPVTIICRVTAIHREVIYRFDRNFISDNCLLLFFFFSLFFS